MNILLIAGEVSGDLYAATLATYLKKQDPNIRIVAVGGDKLKAVCDDMLLETAHQHSVGIRSFLFSFLLKKQLKRVLNKCLKGQEIDRAIIVDFQHFNEYIATFLQRHNVIIDTFVTPNFWMWKDRSQSLRLSQYSRNIVTIFKKEYDYYKQFSDNVVYFGHPLTDHVFKSRFITAQSHKKDEKNCVSFFPGSRKQELDVYLPVMIKVIQYFNQKHHSVLCQIVVSTPVFYDYIKEYLNRFDARNILLVSDSADIIYSQSDAVVSAAGTTTLEAVLTNTPLVVLAALPRVSYWYAKWILKLKFDHVALPNFICDERIVPELLQDEISLDAVITHLEHVMTNKNELLKGYQKVIQCIETDNDVFQRVARLILD